MTRYIKYIIASALILLQCVNSHSQNEYPSLGFWNFKSISGEISLKGLYSAQNSQFSEIREEQSSKYFMGGIKLNTSSFLWQPDIVALTISGEYNPETRNEQYLTIPDRAEVRTLKSLDIRTTLFSGKSISLTSYLDMKDSYFNRENLTNVRSDNRQWGGMMSLKNRVLPINISYRNQYWNQLETESNRQFNMKQNSLQGRASKSFYGNDKHDLTYTYDDYQYLYYDLNAVQNKVSRVTLNDNFYFDQNRNFGYHSSVNYYIQDGTYTFKKFEASERFMFRLPYNFDFRANYNYYRMDDPNQLLNLHRTGATLRHQLFESLTSEVFFDQARTIHTIYEESNFKTGVEFRYTKKIPIGRINLGYRYFRHYNTTAGDQSMIQIVYEEHSINDFEGSYLDKPFADQFSIIVTDASGTIIYQEGLDYLVDIINDYAVITRVPGGQISQDQIVLISYTAIQPGSNHYEADNSTFNAGLTLFNRLIELYYKKSFQNYSNVEYADFLTLNQYDQNLFGARVYYKFFNAGAEYDSYDSNIIPYIRVNYFLNLNFRIKSKFIFSLNSTLRDYRVIGNDVNHRYTNISGRLAYQINDRSKLNMQVGYLSQTGKSIDLDLLTGRVEYNTSLRKMYLSAGVNLYNKKYTTSSFQYARTYIQLTRKF